MEKRKKGKEKKGKEKKKEKGDRKERIMLILDFLPFLFSALI